MASAVEMALARNLQKNFFLQRDLPLDAHGRPVFKTPGPIKGTSLEQPLDNTVVIYRESKTAEPRVGKTTCVFPGDGISISWVVVQRHGDLHFERRDANDQSIPKNIRIASQWANDVQQAHKSGQGFASKIR